jgi:hypothetical protein
MPSAVLEPAIPTIEWQQTYVLDHTATILVSSLMLDPISKNVLTQKIFIHNNQTPNTYRYAKLHGVELITRPDKRQA